MTERASKDAPRVCASRTKEKMRTKSVEVHFSIEHYKHQSAYVGQVEPKASHLCLVTTARLNGTPHDPGAYGVG
ncbi:unnamed protein product [Arctogadus glacialis]